MMERGIKENVCMIEISENRERKKKKKDKKAEGMNNGLSWCGDIVAEKKICYSYILELVSLYKLVV